MNIVDPRGDDVWAHCREECGLGLMVWGRKAIMPGGRKKNCYWGMVAREMTLWCFRSWLIGRRIEDKILD